MSDQSYNKHIRVNLSRSTPIRVLFQPPRRAYRTRVHTERRRIETAVIDRYEGQMAVLLVGKEQRVLDIPRASLPHDARPGVWLQIELDGETLVKATVDAEATAAAQARIAEKLARLRRGEHLQ